MTQAFVLAIDQGTTGTTILVFAHDATVRARSYSELKQYYPKPGWVEHDPREIWRVSLDLVSQALHKAGVGPDDVKAIGITNQRVDGRTTSR